MAARKPKIEVIKSPCGWYFRLKSVNGRILCHSESYYNKGHCLKIVNLIQTTSFDIVEIGEDKKVKGYWGY